MIENGGFDLIAAGFRQPEEIAHKIDEFDPTIEVPIVNLVSLYNARKSGLAEQSGEFSCLDEHALVADVGHAIDWSIQPRRRPGSNLDIGHGNQASRLQDPIALLEEIRLALHVMQTGQIAHPVDGP